MTDDADDGITGLSDLQNLHDFERAARERLPVSSFEFFQGGAADEWTPSLRDINRSLLVEAQGGGLR